METAARHDRRRRLSVTSQGSGNVRFHSSDDSANCLIARIPEDILSEIFLKLDDVRSLIRCRRVCKSWRRIIFSQLFAQSFQATRPEPIVICRSGKLFYFIQAQELSLVAISSYHHKVKEQLEQSSEQILDDLRELGHITGLGTFKDHLSLFCYVVRGHINSLGSSRDALKLFLLNKDGSYKDQKSSCEFSVQTPMEFNTNKDRVIQCFENGTILLWKGDYLYSFVKETRKLKKYSECMIRSEEDVVVHVPRFLSLKDVVKGQSSLVQKLGSDRGQRNELDVVVQKAKSLAELQDDVVVLEAFLREKEEEIRVLHLRLSRYKT